MPAQRDNGLTPPEPEPQLTAIKNSSLTEQTVEGLSWQFLGTAAELVIRISVMIILARLLSPEQFGVAAAATVVINFSQIFAQLGVGQSIVQRRELSSAHIRTGFAFSVWSSACVAVCIFAAAPLIADLFKMPQLRWPVAVLSLAFLFTGPSIVAIALSQRERRYKQIAAVDSLTFTIAYLFVAVGLAYAGLGFWALVIAQLAQSALRSAAFLHLRSHPKGLAPQLTALRDILGSGLGYSLGAVGNFTATNGDNVAVGRMLGAAALGIYGRAYQFLMVPTNLFGAVVDKVMFPAMAHVQHDPVRLGRAFQRSLTAVALIVIPTSGALCILAPELIRLTLGPKWVSVVLPFQILASTTLFRTSSKMSDSLARATGRVYQRAWRQWAYAAAVIIGAMLGSPWGVPGVSVGVGLAITLNFLLMLQLSLAITAVSSKSVTLLHLRCLAGAVPSIALCAAATTWTRAAFDNILISLAAGGAAAGLGLLVSVHWRRAIYGDHAEWIVDLIKKMLLKGRPPKMKP